MNVSDILILLAIAAIAVSGVLRARKRKAAGRGCCGNCSLCGASCPSRGTNDSGNSPPDRKEG